MGQTALHLRPLLTVKIYAHCIQVSLSGVPKETIKHQPAFLWSRLALT